MMRSDAFKSWKLSFSFDHQKENVLIFNQILSTNCWLKIKGDQFGKFTGGNQGLIKGLNPKNNKKGFKINSWN